MRHHLHPTLPAWCASFLLPWLITAPAHALVCPNYCYALECGFSFQPALDCAELPANHALEMTVTCADEIPLAAFPRLVDADGQEREHTWEEARNLTTHASLSTVVVYRLHAPELPAEQRFTLQGLVPPVCQAGSSRHTCGERGGVFCAAHEDPSGCCAVFERAELHFDAPRASPALDEEPPTGPSGGGGAGGASNETPPPLTYLTFFTRAPDDTPPPALRVETSCLRRPNPVFSLFFLEYAVEGPLDDVVQIEIFGRRVSSSDADSSSDAAPPYELVERFTAPPCLDGEERSFTASPEPDALGVICPGPVGRSEEVWRFFARVTDNAGHTTDGPEVTFDSVEDCRLDEGHTSAPSHVCARGPRAPAECTPQELERDPLPSDPLTCPSFSGPQPHTPRADDLGLCRQMTQEEREAPWFNDDRDPDDGAPTESERDAGCSCSTPGAPPTGNLGLFGLGALALWGAAWRTSGQRRRA